MVWAPHMVWGPHMDLNISTNLLHDCVCWGRGDWESAHSPHQMSLCFNQHLLAGMSYKACMIFWNLTCDVIL